MVLSTALFDSPPFKNLVCNGLVLAADGKKMSKRLKNYPVSVWVCVGVDGWVRRCVGVCKCVVACSGGRAGKCCEQREGGEQLAAPKGGA
jgi:hypothetical protein